MKKKFANLGTALSREEAKMVKGGVVEYDDDGGGGGCCAHNADWSWAIVEKTCRYLKPEVGQLIEQ